MNLRIPLTIFCSAACSFANESKSHKVYDIKPDLNYQDSAGSKDNVTEFSHADLPASTKVDDHAAPLKIDNHAASVRIDDHAAPVKIDDHAAPVKIDNHAASVKIDNHNGTSSIVTVKALHVWSLRGKKSISSTLPSIVREGNSFVNLLFKATVGESIQNSSQFDVDGAQFSFLPFTDVTSGLLKAKVCVKVLDNTNKPYWKPVSWIIGIDEEGLTYNPYFCIKLNYAERTWSLYHNDLLVAGDLPLFAHGLTPTITILPGAFKTDIVILKDVSISSIPHGRSAQYGLSAKAGWIDFDAATRAGDSRVKKVSDLTILKGGSK